MYSIKNRKLRNFKNISCKNKPEAGWKGYNFECWKSELCVGQNSQISYSFILNDLILFYQYIHSHSTQLIYSFSILCASLFMRQWLNPRLLPLDSYLLETRVFKDTKIPNVFLVSMDVTRAPDVTTYTHRGDTQKCFIRGGSAPRSNILPFSIEEWYPFHIPSLELYTPRLTVVNTLSLSSLRYG